jgi:single-stranded DNA-specific DHH superfamily exonuclease
MEWFTDGDLAKAKDFLNVRGKKILFYHRDCDGVCSAALWLRFFDDFEARPREGPVMDSGFVKWVADKDPELLVFLDLPVDQEWKKIRKLLDSMPDAKIIIIDHHIVEKDMNSARVLHINPKLKEDSYLPAAFLVYKIMEKFGEIKEGPAGVCRLPSCSQGDVKWIAAMGIVGDYGFEDCGDFLGSVKTKNLDRGAELISAAITLKGLKGADSVLKILLASDNYKEFIRTKTLSAWKRLVDGEFRRVVKEFKDKAERHEDAGLVIYAIESRLNLTSVIATCLSEKMPEKIVLIAKKSGDGWKLSARNQSGRVNLGGLFKRCVKGIGSGGGHKKAAGAIVRDFEKFKKRFIAELMAQASGQRMRGPFRKGPAEPFPEC